ncbi:hypothetical protein MA16_Dca017167 [Dendrobium catenatum]|uniref:Uncharacterized protein n=1 Tax=Dendrobium catenatum TaxID=906689 RepID=A0A2I0XAQ7_9ASPA|nr:hypothetical protein MA16_Dca017167 [Dendrobium catenatum]
MVGGPAKVWRWSTTDQKSQVRRPLVAGQKYDDGRWLSRSIATIGGREKVWPWPEARQKSDHVLRMGRSLVMTGGREEVRR